MVGDPPLILGFKGEGGVVLHNGFGFQMGFPPSDASFLPYFNINF
jgi:hypothetical protein